jgi:peptide/nickel transport system permease protein
VSTDALGSLTAPPEELAVVDVVDTPARDFVATVTAARTPRRGAFAAVHSTWPGRIALGVLALIALLAIVGPLVTPYDPNFQNTRRVLAGPSFQHLLGTDYVGRDVLSRLLAGSTLSVVTALEAVGIAFVVGVIPGLLSVHLGRPFEWATLRLMDSLMALPLMIFAIAVAALLGNGLHQAMFAVGILIAPGFYRLTRAAALSFSGAQYVTAAELMGAAPRWIITKHVWHKVLPVIIVTTANAMSQALLIVASLTFLGIGVVPPNPTWGGMLATDLGYLHQRPYGPLFPSLLVMITVGALNWIADSIRDATSDAGRATQRSRRARRRPAEVAT